MALGNQSTTRPVHYGHWVRSLKDLHCEACHSLICAGERFLFFPWFPGRRHSVACVCCALGVDTSTPSTPVYSVPTGVAA